MGRHLTEVRSRLPAAVDLPAVISDDQDEECCANYTDLVETFDRLPQVAAAAVDRDYGMNAAENCTLRNHSETDVEKLSNMMDIVFDLLATASLNDVLPCTTEVVTEIIVDCTLTALDTWSDCGVIHITDEGLIQMENTPLDVVPPQVIQHWKAIFDKNGLLPDETEDENTESESSQ